MRLNLLFHQNYLAKTKMIAIDWSHTKDLTTYDGRKVRVETLKQLLSRISRDGGESTFWLESIQTVQPPSVVIESGCPLNLIYTLVNHGIEVGLLDNHTTQSYRKEHGIEKTDENDAKIIYELANNGAITALATPDFKTLQLVDFYHQYCRYQKARVAMGNMRKAHKRQYGLSGDSESSKCVNSREFHQLPPDFLAYDIAIDTLQAREKGLLKQLEETIKRLPLFELSGESTNQEQVMSWLQPPKIKGLGMRIWLGLMVTCNPSTFKCLSSYLRFCGLTSDAVKSHKYNRHAKMLYHMLAEEIMKHRDPTFRPIYDKCKADITLNHPDYKNIHIHNATLNRTATFLAKYIYQHSHKLTKE